MSEQIIISVAREYGAGGHKVAEAIAKKYNLTLYDNDILQHIAEESGIDYGELKAFEEKKKNVLFTRTVAGYSNAPQDIVTQMEFDFLKKKANEGESFVVVGRCASYVLREFPALVSVFITSDMDFKVKSVMKHYPELTEKEAMKKILVNNKRRKSFHNHYSKEKWGDSRYYDLIVSTSKIGVDNAIEVVDKYIMAVRPDFA